MRLTYIWVDVVDNGNIYICLQVFYDEDDDDDGNDKNNDDDEEKEEKDDSDDNKIQMIIIIQIIRQYKVELMLLYTYL